MTDARTPRARSLSVRIVRHVSPRPRSGEGFTLDAAFEIPSGVTVLFGPSGAGKSTTLRCIAGVERPSRGTISFGDDIWFDAHKDVCVPAHRRHVALVFQSLALFPHMTAEENVAYGVRRHGGRAERMHHAHIWLERMRVPAVGGRYPKTLSGGEAQRVALARAFASEPEVLLLDEPFSALDAKVKAALLEETRAWVSDANVPTIVVTHDTSDARALGQRTLTIEGGKLSTT